MRKLTQEELLYAATLTPILTEKEGIYKASIGISDNWVAHNNLGAVFLDMAKKEISGKERLNLAVNV